MNRVHPECGWRPAALAAALFAITLNFLQPLAHAALMRGGAPTAPWTIFCSSAAAGPADKSGSVPIAAQEHECCLGLAHAPALIDPSSVSVVVSPIELAAAPSLPAERPLPAGIRDGPSQPRGPPSFV